MLRANVVRVETAALSVTSCHVRIGVLLNIESIVQIPTMDTKLQVKAKHSAVQLFSVGRQDRRIFAMLKELIVVEEE
jgi:hypothetical protein